MSDINQDKQQDTRKKTKAIFKVVVFNIILMLVFLEVASAILIRSGIIDARKPPYTMKHSTQSFWGDLNQHFGVWHLPNSKFRHIRNCFDVLYSANAYGARDKERDLKNTEPRVIVLGDSFMEGMGVEQEERVSDRLEAVSGIEHLNFGSSGHFGPVQEYLLYKHLAKNFDHELIMLGILPDNDFTDLAANRHPDRYYPYWEGTYPNYELKYALPSLEASSWNKDNMGNKKVLKTILLNYTYTRNLYDFFGAVLESRKSQHSLEMQSSQQRSPFSDYQEEDWLMMKHSYEKIIEEAGDKQLFFFTIPRLQDLQWYQENEISPLGAALSEWAVQYPNVWYLDLLPLMAEKVPLAEWPALFIECDDHWTAKGHQIATELIYQYLEDKFY